MKPSSAHLPWGALTLLAPILLFALALSIRLYDLTDLPLDFHPTRQLVSALKARGMYYQTRSDVPAWQKKFAVQQWKTKAEIEPEVFERLVAFTYQFTGEQLWVSRVYSMVFWLVGGLFLYLLARGLASRAGALFALAFYLFLPYAVIASRSFQPDPLMVMLIIAFWWAVNRWMTGAERRSPSEIRWAILAGALGGLAILIKFSAAFFVVGGGVGAVVASGPVKQTLRRPSVWLMAVLGALPGSIYFIYGIFIAGFLGQQFSGRFIPSLLLSPSLYLNWMSTLNRVMGGPVFALALFGIFFIQGKQTRAFVIALWAAYFLYGLYFDYHIWSHDYYNLPLIPLVALSLAPVAAWFAQGLADATFGSKWMRVASLLIAAFALVAVLWEARSTLKSVDYRPEASMWAAVGQELGPDARVVALTQDYGSRLDYWGWVDAAPWPLSGDIYYHAGLRGAKNDFEQRFREMTLKRDFFLITMPDELKKQPFLEQQLAQYPVYLQGDGYVIYDLRLAAGP